MKVVLGLGNPGPRYAGTRHNIGLAVVELVARRWDIALDERKASFRGGQGAVAGSHACLALSRVFMNLSGQAARALWGRMGRQPGNLIVVHDDIDLPLGAVRLKEAGGDGGHRGVRSVIQALGDPGFVRVRIGVGRPAEKEQVVDYVLGRFAPEEAPQAEAAVARGADALEAMFKDGFAAARAMVHGAPKTPGDAR